MAACPTLIFEMSDSLKATVIVILDVLTISTRPEPLALELLVEPRLPALVVAVALAALPAELEEELLDEPDT